MRLRLIVWHAVCAAQAQTIEQVWTRPDACIRGKETAFAIFGAGFDPKTVSARYTGEGGCAKGCDLALDEKRSAGALTGRVRIDAVGDYTVEVRNGSGKPSTPVRFCSVTTPKIAQVFTRPDPPLAGHKVEFLIAGSGFDTDTVTVTLNNIPMATRSKTSGSIAADAVVSNPGDHTISVMNTGDPNVATHTLRVPVPRILAFVASPHMVTKEVPFTFVLSGVNLAPEQTKLLLFRPADCQNGCPPDNLEILQSSSSLLTGRMTVRTPGQFAIGVQSAGTASALHPELLMVR
ncbi:MAG: hypothetical protein FJW30_15445 [Acidobacteria bacterium]|nr:hypothetical protein [Acidobacteriota bacterium]